MAWICGGTVPPRYSPGATRRIFPFRTFAFWLLSPSPASPAPTYMAPSGPKRTRPEEWIVPMVMPRTTMPSSVIDAPVQRHRCTCISEPMVAVM
jgi:hypothetical protein